MSKRMKIPEALREAYAAARAEHWTFTWTRGSHPKLQPPAGRFVITGSTQRRTGHSIGNDLSRLRKAGLEC
jgi:hypothetical protein